MKICTCHGIEAQAKSAINYPFDLQAHICAISGRSCDVEDISDPITTTLE